MLTYKDIIFYTPEHVKDFYNPKPTSKFIPKWFKALSDTENPENKNKGSLFLNKHNQPQTDGTVKKCVPFLDAYRMGYIVPLPYDLMIKKEDQGCKFFSGVESSLKEQLIGSHSISQIKGSPIDPKSNENKIYKINSPWRIKTPKGYSCLFTAPLNRPELPLIALSGVVDTDTYHSINFTFSINLEEGEHLIEGGTPFVQVIPFKRDNWKSKSVGFDKDMLNSEHRQVLGYLNDFYKRIHFKKKTFL
jgi:hypothetical protein